MHHLIYHLPMRRGEAVMHALIQGILGWYFATLQQFGLLGVVVLMAMESSIFPVPSELVIPPAAYLESHAKGGGPLLTVLVIHAGTLGSYLGSAITYWVARAIGRPLIVRYGKYIFIPEKKLQIAEQWVAHYGAGGIFFARLMPVVRHLISIPAGIMGLRFRTFSIMTILGSFIWCTVLTFFGLFMAKDMAIVIEGRGAFHNAMERQQFEHAMNNLTWATLLLVAVVFGLYLFVQRQGHRKNAEAAVDSPADETPSCL
jgi:membrane protein DedA with SNARE-associated domain